MHAKPLWSGLTLCSPMGWSMGLSRQGYGNVLPCLPPGDIPDPEIEPKSPASPNLQEDSLPTEPPGKLLT